MAAAAGLVVMAHPALPAATDDIPDIGSSADAVLTRSKAEQIGRAVVMRLREDGQLMEDPEIAEYLDGIGHRLSAQAHEGDHEFNFFHVNDPAINAFALPGGYVGINAGLILATQRESELAGVLAHEIAHVTQRHIAHRVEAQTRSSMLATAAILAAILMGATGQADSNVVQAAAMSAQAYAVQSAVNYTRGNEYEADRVGLGILHDAGFDPYGMPDFFETMNRLNGRLANRIPEFLLTHPVTSTRIAETRQRAEKLPAAEVRETENFALMRERLRVLTARSPQEVIQYFTSRIEGLEQPPEALRYGLALAYLRAGRPDDALPILYDLRAGNDSVVAYHSALGQAMLAARQPNEAMIVFRQALELSPRNVPLTVRYAETLLATGQPAEAHKLLLDLFNTVPPTPAQIKLIANAAAAAGERAEAHYYMSEYYISGGDLRMAYEQLALALAQPDVTEHQRSRFTARREEIRPYLPKERQERPIEQARRDQARERTRR